MVISTCGYGYTGASAVLDFLRGYDSVQILKSVEFQMLHQADGILDLKYYLVENRERIACNTAIKRFKRLQKTGTLALRLRKLMGDDFDRLTNEYIGDIIQVTWLGRSNYDPSDISNESKYGIIRFVHRAITFACRRLKIKFRFPRYKERYFSIMTEQQFDELTKNYIEKLMSGLNIDMTRDVALDMLFSATNPRKGTEFFDNAKTIIVDRDPRDIFIVSQRTDEEYSFMPWDTGENFVKYYRLLRENTVMDENVLVVRYEDLIYDYWNTTQRIMDYLGYTERPNNEFKYFNPDISVKYTNLKETAAYSEEIKYIEEHLPEYLYEFKPYVDVKEQAK